MSPAPALGCAQVPSSPEGLWSQCWASSSRTSDPSPLSLAVSIKTTALSPTQVAAELQDPQPLLLSPAQPLACGFLPGPLALYLQVPCTVIFYV